MLAYWLSWLRSKLARVGGETGQGLVEFALIIVLIAIALIALLTIMEGGVEEAFKRIKEAIMGTPTP